MSRIATSFLFLSTLFEDVFITRTLSIFSSLPVFVNHTCVHLFDVLRRSQSFVDVEMDDEKNLTRQPTYGVAKHFGEIESIDGASRSSGSMIPETNENLQLVS